MNMEGIVAKKINSKYQINTRSEDWLKIKNYQKGEFVVLGYINKENSYVISLILGEHLKGKLKYVGKVSLGKKRSLANKIMNMKNIKPILEIKEKDIKGFDQNLQKNSTFLKIERCCFSMCFRTFEWILKENSHRRNPQSRLRYILSHDTMSASEKNVLARSVSIQTSKAK